MLTSTRRRRTRLGAVSLVLLLPLLGACGFNYQTDQVYQPAVGVNSHKGSVDVLGAVVVYAGEGKGTFVASLVNKDTENDDKLVSVSGEDVKGQLSAPVDVPAGQLVNLADTGAVGLEGDTIEPGAFVRVSLQFESGLTSEVNAPVVPHTDEYEGVKLFAPATPSASPSETPSP